MSRKNGNGKIESKVKNWSSKMSAYYSEVSDSKLSTNLKAAGFKVRNKNK
ncbi:hypothetical protein [Cohnella silvisoli]|uniref:Uncharacterized protein n=1 Tax=Cohnella silvisoli TaxID=2873699 RepID=A0ABV1KNL7_9BACL|nr:hypothetical protein [Cohnella silvisoli]MCD9020244.1 hypothetical protein [Cohnella silvisoli]